MTVTVVEECDSITILQRIILEDVTGLATDHVDSRSRDGAVVIDELQLCHRVRVRPHGPVEETSCALKGVVVAEQLGTSGPDPVLRTETLQVHCPLSPCEGVLHERAQPVPQ